MAIPQRSLSDGRWSESSVFSVGVPALSANISSCAAGESGRRWNSTIRWLSRSRDGRGGKQTIPLVGVVDTTRESPVLVRAGNRSGSRRGRLRRLACCGGGKDTVASPTEARDGPLHASSPLQLSENCKEAVQMKNLDFGGQLLEDLKQTAQIEKPEFAEVSRGLDFSNFKEKNPEALQTDSSEQPVTARAKAKPPGPPPPSGRKSGNFPTQPTSKFSVPPIPPPLPTWAGPVAPPGWQAACAVNWHPIRDAGRWEGSIWQRVHGRIEDGTNDLTLPDDLISVAFGQNSSTPRRSMQRPEVVRQLPRQLAMTADLRFMQLSRLGLDRPEKLAWVVGSQLSEEPVQDGSANEEEPILPEDALEGLLDLLECASGTFERRCAEVASVPDGAAGRFKWAPSEVFLRRLLAGWGPPITLRPRIELALRLTRFPAEAAAVESEIGLAQEAATSILNSDALPTLMEGVLLLGNYINSGRCTRNLDGVVGVALESLAKLAHTRCASGQAQRTCSQGPGLLRSRSATPDQAQWERENETPDNALHLLVRHLQQRMPGFGQRLDQDLRVCGKAIDFDIGATTCTVQRLTTLVKTAAERTTWESPTSTGTRRTMPKAICPDRLRRFLHEADPTVLRISSALAKLEESIKSLRKHFAESPDRSFADIMGRLTDLHKALPAPTLAAGSFLPTGLASSRGRLEEHNEAQGTNSVPRRVATSLMSRPKVDAGPAASAELQRPRSRPAHVGRVAERNAIQIQREKCSAWDAHGRIDAAPPTETLSQCNSSTADQSDSKADQLMCPSSLSMGVVSKEKLLLACTSMGSQKPAIARIPSNQRPAIASRLPGIPSHVELAETTTKNPKNRELARNSDPRRADTPKQEDASSRSSAISDSGGALVKACDSLAPPLKEGESMASASPKTLLAVDMVVPPSALSQPPGKTRRYPAPAAPKELPPLRKPPQALTFKESAAEEGSILAKIIRNRSSINRDEEDPLEASISTAALTPLSCECRSGPSEHSTLDTTTDFGDRTIWIDCTFSSSMGTSSGDESICPSAQFARLRTLAESNCGQDVALLVAVKDPEVQSGTPGAPGRGPTSSLACLPRTPREPGIVVTQPKPPSKPHSRPPLAGQRAASQPHRLVGNAVSNSALQQDRLGVDRRRPTSEFELVA